MIPNFKFCCEKLRIEVSVCHCVSYEVMLQCWQFSPIDRPTFKQLADTFDSFLASSVVCDYQLYFHFHFH